MWRQAALFLTCLTVSAQDSGTLTCTITDAQSTMPIAGISAILVAEPGAASTFPVQHFRADSAGRFTATAPAGLYRVCVDEALGFADSCQWGQAAVTVQAGENTPLPIRLSKGIWLVVNLIDDDGIIKQSDPVAPLSVIATGSDGRQHIIPLSDHFEGGLVFRLLVPPGKYGLVASSPYLALADAVSVPLPTGALDTKIDTSDYVPLPTWIPRYFRAQSNDERVIALRAIR